MQNSERLQKEIEKKARKREKKKKPKMKISGKSVLKLKKLVAKKSKKGPLT